MVRCLNCMQEYEQENTSCSHCGFKMGSDPKEPYHLYPGTELNSKYIIGTIIGFGGFGNIYKAWDKNLQQVVAIKEYYPTAFLNRVPGERDVYVYDQKKRADFEKGRTEFLEEARNLAKFNSHPNIVHVYDFFEENGTAYFTMEYLNGYNLRTYLSNNKKNNVRVSTETALQITQCILNALKAIHAEGIIHRDIKPANIFICRDNTIKLIDLGAARFSDNEMEKMRTIIITPGYAPAEQYQLKSKQGPATDIYAVAAVLYEMLTGIKPEESINRKVKDTVADPIQLNPEIPEAINAAVMRAMAVQSEVRFQTVEKFSEALVSRRKVRDARREISYRNKRRNVRIAILLSIVIMAAAGCFIRFQQIKKEAVLEAVQLTVWLPYGEEGKKVKEELVKNMSAEFLSNNSQIELEVVAIPEGTYETQLKNAFEEGNAPDVFFSTALPEEMKKYMAELSSLFTFSLFEADSYYFLDRYKTMSQTVRQLPLTVDVPILYENTLLEKKQENIASNTYTQFVNQEVRHFLGTLVHYPDVQKEMSGMYQLGFSSEDIPEPRGEFGNFWSINASVSEEVNIAAIRLLYYFLSDTAQDYLTVQQDNCLPLNKNILDVYVDVNGDFVGMDEYLERVIIEEK